MYAIVMVHPSPATIALGFKAPSDFTRKTFREMLVKCHEECGTKAVETACFLEPHANGEMHLNLLLRASSQFRWKPVAERLLQHYKVHVSFGRNVRTWAEGVVYFRVASEHKGPEGLDKDPEQWHKDGCPTPFEDFLPRRWQQPGYVRPTRLTSLAFYEFCLEHSLRDETAVWAKATELSQTGDKGLLAYLLDNDVETQLAKVVKAMDAQENARRAGLTRQALLEEYAVQSTCCCSAPGRGYELQKEILSKNGLDGTFQEAVYSSLVSGRAKKRNLCLLGPADCGKSFLFKGLREVYRCYERPDGGTYQLEDLLDCEVVFLNDFEYDTKAKDWMPWSYFKNFLEGGHVKVGRPKNRGGNKLFKGTAPVFFTAPEEVKLYSKGVEVYAETAQVRKRICYFTLKEQIPEDKREEVLRHCGHCAARLYLEGKAPAPHDAARPTAAAALLPSPSAASSPKKRRLNPQEVVKELTDLKALLDAGLLTRSELDDLKNRLLA